MSDKKILFSTRGFAKPRETIDRQAIFKEAYVVIPREVMTDIVTSFFPKLGKGQSMGSS